MTTPTATIPRPRCALRQVVVAADLAALGGPDGGMVELPQRLFWSGPGRVFDLADPDQALEMYEAVFDGARSESDLASYINGELLARMWPELALAPRVRRAWEAEHPLLALAGTVPETAGAVPDDASEAGTSAIAA